MSIKIQQTKYKPVPQGIYAATVENIEAESGQYGPQLKFTFKLDPFEGYEDGRQMLAWCSQKFSPKSKLYIWTSALMGKIPDDYTFDSDDLINKKCLLVIGQRTSSNGGEYDHIEKIKPLRPQKSLEDVNQSLGDIEAEAPA